MPIADKVVTLKANSTAVSAIHIYPQVDGSFVVHVEGVTRDDTNQLVNLSPAKLAPAAGQVASLDGIAARALVELRKANGLET